MKGPKLPPSVRRLVTDFDAWIVGSAADPNELFPKDIDVMVPWTSWHVATAIIPQDAKKNTFGGWKFEDEGVSVDIWPDDLGRMAASAMFRGAWHPKTGTRLIRINAKEEYEQCSEAVKKHS